MARGLSAADVLDLGDYERARPERRKSAMAARALRRVEVGPNASLAFENRETLLYQVQEMLRAERIVDRAAIEHELETYGELLPAADALSATLLIEFPDAVERAVRLAELVGLERHLHLAVGEARVTARFDPRQIDPDKVSAVQFVRFVLDAPTLAALRAGAPVRVVLDHPRYPHQAALSAETVRALLSDLQ